MRGLAPLMLPVALLAAGVAVLVPGPATTASRVAQHVLSLTIQLLASASAAALAWQAARTYGPRDRERAVWFGLTAAAALWTAGLILYGAAEWSGRSRPYPSSADVAFAGAVAVLALALVGEWRAVAAMLSPGERRALLLGGVALAAAVVAGVLWPIALTPMDPLEKALDLFYPLAGLLLVPLGLAPAVAFRGGAAGGVWTMLAVGIFSLGAGSVGFAYLTWFDLYTDVHPVNLLRIGGFACIGAAAAWHRRASEAI